MTAPDFAARYWTSLDGLKLYARDYGGGDGPARLPVICLHGLTRNSADFELVAPYIAATGRRVLAPDVRGRGHSARDPHPANYNPVVYAQDVATMMEALGVARALFVGTSMGGIITMSLAATRPDLVAGAVLNDIGAELSGVGLARIATFVGIDPHVKDWQGAADYLQAGNQAYFPAYGPDDWRTLARRTFTDRHGRVAPDYDLAIAEVARLTDPQNPPDLWPLFSSLAAGRPTLLVHGELSDLLAHDTVERMRRAEFDMTYALVRGVGHPPTLSEPAAVHALDAFLRKAP